MITEYTEQGYWLASGSYQGRTILAEGETRGQAATAWIDHVAGIDDGYLGTFPFARSSAGLSLPVVCAWCHRLKEPYGWIKTTGPIPGPVSHGICDACKAQVESDIAASKF